MSISSRVLTSAVMLAIFAGMTFLALGFPAQKTGGITFSRIRGCRRRFGQGNDLGSRR